MLSRTIDSFISDIALDKGSLGSSAPQFERKTKVVQGGSLLGYRLAFALFGHVHCLAVYGWLKTYLLWLAKTWLLVKEYSLKLGCGLSAYCRVIFCYIRRHFGLNVMYHLFLSFERRVKPLRTNTSFPHCPDGFISFQYGVNVNL